MKIGFVVPVIKEFDIDLAYNNIEKACLDCKAEFEIIFALNTNLNTTFTNIRSKFVENSKVSAFMVDKKVEQHQLITIAMEYCEGFDATVIYTAKEDFNVEVIKAFITSWQAGNKIVYLKKIYTGFNKFMQSVGRAFYNIGTKVVGVYKDMHTENDIQLLDRDVILTINKLPEKNRQLRTLDSFIGYPYDIIHMQINKPSGKSKEYDEKPKKFYTNISLAYVFLALSCLSLITDFVLIIANVKAGLLGHFLLWFAVFAFLYAFIIYFTKAKLVTRVGVPQDREEIKSLTEKIEKYNIW